MMTEDWSEIESEAMDRIITEKSVEDAIKILAYVFSSQPERVHDLVKILSGGNILYGVKDVARWTTWSEGHIRRLCQREELPHIPGQQLKFYFPDVIQALKKMQRGDRFGRRGRSRKTKKAISKVSRGT